MSRLSIRQLAEAARSVHFVEVEYQGDKYEFPWMELQEDEMPLLPSAAEGADKDEVANISVKGLEELTFAMVSKGSARAGEELERTTWDDVPKRIRNDVMLRIFNIRVEAQKDFLEHPTKI